MTRKTLVFVGFALFATGAICAADVPQVHSALITDVTVTPNDSPLVRAAKLVALSRAQMTVHSTRVIDNDTLRTMGSSHFAIATTEPQPLPTSHAPVTLGPSSSAVSPYRQQNQTFVPPSTAPVVPTSPFSLPPPPPTSSPIPYRPQP